MPSSTMKSSSSSYPTTAIVVGVVAFVAGAFVHSFFSKLPTGVSFDHLPNGLPANSPVRFLPPWAIFKPAVALQDTLARAAFATLPPPIQVLQLGSAFWHSEVTYALLINGIIDKLGQANGMTCENVASEMDFQKHHTCEYMKAGALLGLLNNIKNEQGESVFTLTEAGSLLQTGVPGSLRDYTLLANEESARTAWRATALKGIKSGQSGMMEGNGMEFWTWHQTHPDKEAQFDRAMQNLGYTATGAMLGEWEPASKTGNHVVCDIGGGMGANAKLILDHYPNMSAIVFDQPVVAERANEHFAKEGYPSNRAKAIGGDFFQAFPEELKECDTFFLRFILHDWSDEDGVTILRNLNAVAKPGSELIVAEYVLETSDLLGFELSKQLMSIAMMVLLRPGAKERTLAQYQELYDQAGMGNSSKAELILTRDSISMMRVNL